jgi:hypothetical protein
MPGPTLAPDVSCEVVQILSPIFELKNFMSEALFMK